MLFCFFKQSLKNIKAFFLIHIRKSSSSSLDLLANRTYFEASFSPMFLSNSIGFSFSVLMRREALMLRRCVQRRGENPYWRRIAYLWLRIDKRKSVFTHNQQNFIAFPKFFFKMLRETYIKTAVIFQYFTIRFSKA